jgi:hypothetical protein
VWEIIQRFGGIAQDELNGRDINRLENVMTLAGYQRAVFGALHFWLEAVDVSSVYSVLASASTDFLFLK